MEQRRLRLGDIVDDYCPRERRVTNHAIVAMIEEDIRQTRCTTCDAEHAYKGARLPKRRKKETETLIAALGAPPDTPADLPVRAAGRPDELVPVDDGLDAPMPEPAVPATAVPESDAPQPESGPVDPIVDGPVHRPLIRATLPRPEGQKDARPLPEFTIRQSGGRGPAHHGGGAGYRGDRLRVRGGGNGANGNRAHGANGRFQPGNRPQGAAGRSPNKGRGGPGFRHGNAGPNGKRGRSRG